MPSELNFKSPPSTGTPQPPKALAVNLQARMLAEAVRLHEHSRGELLDDPAAEAAARQAGGDLEQRIVSRANTLALAPDLAQALRQLRGAVLVVLAIALLLAVVGGAATARAALGNSGEANFFWVLGGILGVHCLTLLAWLGLMLVRPGALAGGSLGGVVFSLGQRISQRLHEGPVQLAAVRAVASVFSQGFVGRWTLSAISHALWLGFLLGSLVMVLLVLSTHQFTFVWETTILSERSYVPLTRGIASLPEFLGFTTPDIGQIRASRGGLPEAASAGIGEAWAGLLVGAVVVYGLLPRLVLLVLSVGLARRSARRFRLDISLPGFARLESRLMPTATNLGVVDAEPDPVPFDAGAVAGIAPRRSRGHGPVAVLGLELDVPAANWPPTLAGIEWLDLGMVDSRDDRRRVKEQLATALTPPRLIAVVCSALNTPDRGVRAFITDLERHSDAPVALIVSDGQRLRERSSAEEATQRLADWHTLAAEAGIDEAWVGDVDLAHLTDISRARLGRLLGAAKGVEPIPARRIERAFELIGEHAARWSGPPGQAQQAELHRLIARLYQSHDGHRDWQALLGARLEDGGASLADQLQGGARRMTELLPRRLRLKPRWLAAGATAGALGCVAAATLVSPAAIASLPLWAGLGSVLTAVLPDRSNPTGTATEEPVTTDLGQGVGAAALFAVLLELQGRDEAAITRIIDQVAGDDVPVMEDAGAVRRWLDDLRHRLDLALSQEGSL